MAKMLINIFRKRSNDLLRLRVPQFFVQLIEVVQGKHDGRNDFVRFFWLQILLVDIHKTLI